jgi:hypothetical protein
MAPEKRFYPHVVNIKDNDTREGMKKAFEKAYDAHDAITSLLSRIDDLETLVDTMTTDVEKLKTQMAQALANVG